MDAVLRVDLQPVAALAILDGLIDAGRAVSALRAGVFHKIFRQPLARVAQFQMRWLVFLVIGVGEEDRGIAVKAEDAIGLGVVDFWRLGRSLQAGMVGMVAHGPGGAAFEDVGVQGGIHQAAPHAPFGEGGADVAHGLEFFPEPALFQHGGVFGQNRGAILAGQCGHHRLGRHHAALHRGVGALDLGHVEEARRIADQRAAGEDQLGDGLEATLIQRPRAIGNALAAFEEFAHLGMGLEALKLIEGAEPGVGVVEAHHKAHAHQILAQHIEPGAAIGVALQRPAGGMPDEAGGVLLLGDLPQLLQADRIGLLLHAIAQGIGLEEFFGQRTAAALGEEGVAGAQLHAGLVVRPLAAIARNAHHPGHDAFDHTILDDGLGGGEAGVDFHPQRLGPGTQPAGDIAERDDVIAVIVHLRRRGQFDRPGLGQHHEAVIAGRGGQGRRVLAPIGDQLIECARLQHRAAEDMRADLAALLHDADRRIGRELLDTDRRGQASRPRPHDQYVEFHRFALGHRFLPHFRHNPCSEGCGTA